MSEAGKYFAGGPPYLAIASDFKVIAEKWKEFVGRAYEHKPGDNVTSEKLPFPRLPRRVLFNIV